MRTLRTTMVALTAALGFAVPAHAAPHATITGAFADACRSFTAGSTKDISHVEVHYTDGRVVKDEAVMAPGYSIDGGAGDEIDVAVVKSGTTTRTFRCDSGSPPVAVLEIRLSPYCQPATSSPGETFYWCSDGSTNPQRTVYVDPGDLRIDMGCLPTEPLCLTVTLRGSSSTDPDGDLAGWSIAFGDGTVVSGDWATTPPAEVTHEFLTGASCGFTSSYCHLTLTVTDAHGRSDTDSIDLAFYDISPD